MKLCKLSIRDFQQFKNLELNFTHPETGEPLEKICFIGSNGTGKSTIIQLISNLLHLSRTNYIGKTCLEIEIESANTKRIIGIHKNNNTYFLFKDELVNKDVQSIETIVNFSYLNNGVNVSKQLENEFSESILKDNAKDLLIHIETEAENNIFNRIQDVPQTSLNDALEFNRNFSFFHSVNQATTQSFWKLLIFNIIKREQNRNSFENISENLAKTKKQLINEFDSLNPKILDSIAKIWNNILAKAGLEFDVDNAQIPTQLTDNLRAYIRLKSTGERIQYYQLSTGIRNFIFRIGHIYSLYFNREIKRGFLLVDEPENSLFPDFLLDIIDSYKEATIDKNGEQNTQMFFATHNPIVAAQFEPYERIILEWTDTGDVVARRGTAPLGDDPNDLLVKDFEISSLMPKPGIDMWEKYLTLKRQLRTTSDTSEKEELVTEILEIGKEYNFPRDQPKV